MKKLKSLADLKSDPRIDSVSDERGYGEGIWVYANDRDGYFIEGGSEAGGSYVQIHEDTLRGVLKQANRIKHISEFSEEEKQNLREWAAANRYRIKENPMKKSATKQLMAIPPKDWLDEADRRERAGDKQGAKTARQFARFLMGQKDAFENPVKPRKGESERKFVSRCMSEEKKSFPKQKQRIAVCLSKARKNPFNDRNLDA